MKITMNYTRTDSGLANIRLGLRLFNDLQHVECFLWVQQVHSRGLKKTRRLRSYSFSSCSRRQIAAVLRSRASCRASHNKRSYPRALPDQPSSAVRQLSRQRPVEQTYLIEGRTPRPPR